MKTNDFKGAHIKYRPYKYKEIDISKRGTIKIEKMQTTEECEYELTFSK